MGANTISFTQQIKEEIVSLSYEDNCARALLAAFVQINGRMIIQNKKTILILETENAKIAKFFYLLIQQRYQVVPSFAYRKKMNFDKRTSFNLRIESDVDRILEDLQITFYEKKVSKSFLRKDDEIRCFLAGTFLATGSCNAPTSSNYHLEISSNDEEMIKYILKLLEKNKEIHFGAKTIARRHHFVLYIKKSDQIANFIAYIGASYSCLQFEEVRVERDFVNSTNRLQICANANYQKTTASATRQLADIAIIEECLGIQNLSNQKLKYLCLLRKENEDASMIELAELLSEEIGKKVSKSNINHLFRYLHELAVRYGGSKE